MEFTDRKGVVERSTKWQLADMYKEAESSWLLQSIFRTIIQEVKRPGWDVEPKFKVKCKVCLSEYQDEIEECEMCGATGDDLVKPDPAQLAKARRLLERPNSLRQTFGDILTSIIMHDLVADDWYLSVGYAPVKSLSTWKPKEVYVEDPRYFKLLADERGRIGRNADGEIEYFCPVCYPDVNTIVKKEPFVCPDCGIEAKPTVYVQKLHGEVKNRFTVEQVVNGSTYRVLPYPFGQPRMVSIWEMLQALKSIDAWYYDTMRFGEVNKIITFDGYTPEEVDALAQLIRESEQRMDSVHPLYGEERMNRKPKRLMLGATGGVGVHDIMPKPTELEALEFYRLGIQGIAGVYGAQLIFIAQEQSRGQSAATAIRIEIQNRTIEEIQRDKEEILTNQLFPIFGITDYKFAFGDLEKKDELRDAQIDQTKASTAATLVNAGFMVEIDDEKNLSFSGVVDGQEFVQNRNPFGGFGNTVGETEQKPRISDATGAEIEGTSTERWPSGTRPPRSSKSRGYQPIVVTKEPDRTEHVVRIVPENGGSKEDIDIRKKRLELLEKLMEDEE